MSRIIENIKNNHPDVPIILFTKNGGLWLQQIIDSGADAIGLDWTMDIGVAQDLVKDKVALQGNMDPSILYSSSDQIRKEVHKILTSYGQPTGHIFNLGHGIYPDVPVENVEILVDSVHDISQTLYR
jgi:uroporphyrinogen decarboxylase